MPRYSIAFITPESALLHQVVEMDSRESALRFFFNQFVASDYTKDAEGYSYFKEDFSDPVSPMGSILEL